jgi:hypothetical protein
LIEILPLEAVYVIEMMMKLQEQVIAESVKR